MAGNKNMTWEIGKDKYPRPLREVPSIDPRQPMQMRRPLRDKDHNPTGMDAVETVDLTIKECRVRVDKGWEFLGLGEPVPEPKLALDEKVEVEVSVSN